MAQLPLFTPDYLSSPTMMGAISPTTARIMSETGGKLSALVEKNNQVLEAKAKAPEIANMMAQGLTALSSGDMSGFSSIANARAAGASNPLLAKMTDDALSTGSRMANAYIDNKLSASKADDTTARMFYLQQYNDWDTQRRSIEAGNAKERLREADDTAALVEKKKMGDPYTSPVRPAQITPIPPPPQPPPSVAAKLGQSVAPTTAAAPPTSRGPLPFGHKPTAAVQGAGPLFDTAGSAGQLDMADVPVVADATPVKSDGSMEGPLPVKGPVPSPVGPQVAQASPEPPEVVPPTPSGQAPTTETAAAAQVTERTPADAIQMRAAELYKSGDKEGANKLLAENKLPLIDEEPRPLVNETKPPVGIDTTQPREPKRVGDKLRVGFGRMDWMIPTDAASKMRITKTINDSTGSTRYILDPGPGGKKDENTELAELLIDVDNKDHKFALWASAQMHKGKEVRVEPNPTDPKKPWIAKSDDVPMGDEAPDGTITPHPISPEVGKSFARGRQLIIKNKPQPDYPITDEMMKAGREKDIAMINASEYPEDALHKVNKILRSKGEDPLTADVITKPTSGDPEVVKELKRRGYEDPYAKAKPPAPPKEPQTINELDRAIVKAGRQLKDKPELYAKMIEWQKRIQELRAEQEEKADKLRAVGALPPAPGPRSPIPGRGY